MSLLKLMQNYTGYNKWANQKYIDWLRSKPAEMLSAHVPSSFPTILQTLNHLWSTQEFWRGIIAETTDIINKYDATEFVSDEIFNGIQQSSEQLDHFIKNQSDQDLLRSIKVVNPWFQCDLPRFEYIQHVIGHSIYHRGQLVTMGRLLGITDAPMTDYNFYNVLKEKSS